MDTLLKNFWLLAAMVIHLAFRLDMNPSEEFSTADWIAEQSQVELKSEEKEALLIENLQSPKVYASFAQLASTREPK